MRETPESSASSVPASRSRRNVDETTDAPLRWQRMREDADADSAPEKAPGTPGSGAEPAAPGLGDQQAAAHILAVLDDSCEAGPVLNEAHDLAGAFHCNWSAICIETPGRPNAARAADALSKAAEMGAFVASISAAHEARGVSDFAASSGVTHVVIGSSAPGSRWSKPALAQQLIGLDGLRANIVAVPSVPGDTSDRGALSKPRTPGFVYPLALASVVLTSLLLLLVSKVIGAQTLALLFVFPVIGIAARWGLKPAVFTAVAAVACYNFLLLKPAFTFTAEAPQNLIMLAVLLGLGIYTSILTGRLRDRVLLGDRSAQENAALATLGLELTRVGSWEETAQIICRETAALLQVEAAVVREVGGTLEVAAGVPAPPVFTPLDQAALDWTWNKGEEAGSGTEMMAASNWQFQPLKTSLGTLAILCLAREDGRDPVRADRKVLLSTLVAQAALAHERLRLEDNMRSSSAS